LTTAEVLLYRYKVVITDHKNKPRVGKMVQVPLKEKLKEGLKNLPGKITQENLDKGLKTFDKGMADFSKAMDDLGSGLGGNGSHKETLWGKPNKTNNVEKLMGKPRNNVEIWGKKKTPRRKGKKKKPETSNVEKIWGKRK